MFIIRNPLSTSLRPKKIEIYEVGAIFGKKAFVISPNIFPYILQPLEGYNKSGSRLEHVKLPHMTNKNTKPHSEKFPLEVTICSSFHTHYRYLCLPIYM